MQSLSLWRWLTKLPLAARLAKWRGLVAQVESHSSRVESLDEAELQRGSLALRYRASAGEPLERLLPEGFALVREASGRALKMRHFPTQLLGGAALHFGSIAEMQTGEGKTLTATLPLYLAALAGKGAHLATANDYLAQRDAEFIRPAFGLLGMSVASVTAGLPDAQRREAYTCDITYGTAKEFGFDFLRDRLREDASRRDEAKQAVQRSPNFLLIDEADSILLDEARTPLIISGAGSVVLESVATAQWAAAAATQFKGGTHYELNAPRRTASVSGAGRQLARSISRPDELAEVPLLDLYEAIELALQAAVFFHCDRHYVIRDGEVVIIDENTGRTADGRRWRGGLHQAIEAKEGLEISAPTQDSARLTVGALVRRYPRLAGMTGTVGNSSAVFRRLYGLRSAVIPTHRPPRREQLPDVVVRTAEEKWQAIVEEVTRVHASGQPVLIGTRSISLSEQLSERFRTAKLEHEVLSARHVAREAEVIAQAGERGRITVATNMAGRGTDIRLGNGVAELGGLYVICSEMHDSSRIDRQLIGRCGRQGDPGRYRRFFSLDDDVLRDGLGREAAQRLIDRARSGSLDSLLPHFEQAQRNLERRHARQLRLLSEQEKRHRERQEQLGQDPFLDLVD